jgi:hypothetical protein
LVEKSGANVSPFQVKHFSNIGASEEFLWQLVPEMSELIGATSIREPKRAEVRHAIMIISLEGMMPAFEHLKRIRASVTQELPVLNRRQLYEDFTRVLWHGYKDLMPRAAALIGSNIGFLFQNDANFEKGLCVFKEAHPKLPSWFGDHLRDQHKNWQNDLADFRNHYLEHREEEPDRFQVFYQAEAAEAFFYCVWRTTADILVVLLSMNLFPGLGLDEIPVAERSALNPRRFRFVHKSLDAGNP